MSVLLYVCYCVSDDVGDMPVGKGIENLLAPSLSAKNPRGTKDPKVL
jgi:hypothetical protein